MWVCVEHEGERLRLSVAHTPQGVWVGWPGGSTRLDVATQFASEALCDDAVTAPMTGRVVEVRVRAGDAVAADDVLLVLEAMKMEYRLTAPRAGVVERVHCAAGELVDLGAILVTLDG